MDKPDPKTTREMETQTEVTLDDMKRYEEQEETLNHPDQLKRYLFVKQITENDDKVKSYLGVPSVLTLFGMFGMIL